MNVSARMHQADTFRASCCPECERTGGSCGGGRMATAVDANPPAGNPPATGLDAPTVKVVIVAGSVAYTSVIGAVAGAVAQDKGKRLKGAGWGALTAGLLGGVFSTIAVLTMPKPS